MADDRASLSKRLTAEVLKESDSNLIDKLHLRQGNHLKRAAVLLFHPDPERFITGAFVKIAYFRTNSDLLFHDEIRGSLFAQIDRTMDLLLTKYLKAIVSYDGLQRLERYPIPEDALREALLNAIAHKDYASGIPIQISVYEDRLLFWNNGELAPNWTVETLTGKHASQPPNPDIANTLFRAGMIEAWGRGIEHIFTSCKAAGGSPPTLRYEGNGLWLEFPIHTTAAPLGPKPEPGSLEEQVLALLDSGPKAKAELAAALGQQKVSGQLNKVVRKLLEAHRIERTLPDKPQSRLQKYRNVAPPSALQPESQPESLEEQVGALLDPGSKAKLK